MFYIYQHLLLAGSPSKRKLYHKIPKHAYWPMFAVFAAAQFANVHITQGNELRFVRTSRDPEASLPQNH